jgi:hypothetical protein
MAEEKKDHTKRQTKAGMMDKSRRAATEKAEPVTGNSSENTPKVGKENA